MSLPEGPYEDKDLKGFKPPTDIESLATPIADLSGTDSKYLVDQTQFTRLRYRSLNKNKDDEIIEEIKDEVALKSEISYLKQDTLEIKSMMTKIFKAFKGQSSSAPSSSINHKTNPKVALIESFSRPPLTDTILEILIPQPTGPWIDITPPEPQVTQREGKGIIISDESPKKPIYASTIVCQDPNEPIQIPYEIHRKLYNLTNDELQEYLKKKEEIKKKDEQARLLEMTKSEIIKFKKIQDAEHQVLKRAHSQKAKKAIDLRKKRLEQVIELDELGPIILKKTNKIVGKLMISLGKSYERLGKIFEELGIQLTLPPPAPKQASS
uniref:Uncharacterized protein n=1 Tax=Tanacetum cinerariifolium TaxID=118510 RepID=A0A699GX48_TANCI|nr:hypothetical protein [Tanacetum cinerariifolium]